MSDKLDNVVDSIFSDSMANRNNERLAVGTILVPKQNNELMAKVKFIDYAVNEVEIVWEDWEEDRAVIVAGVADEELLKELDYWTEEFLVDVAEYHKLPDNLDLVIENNQVIVKENNGSQN